MAQQWESALKVSRLEEILDIDIALMADDDR